MGYFLYAFVAKEPLLRNNIHEFEDCHIVSLQQRIEMLILTKEFLENFADDENTSKVGILNMLTPKAAEWAKRISMDGPVAYIEAEFFGGLGGQRSVIWHSGRVVSETKGSGPINLALNFLGVTTKPPEDEFIAAGLKRHRDAEGWINESINGRN
jgi:hypothetical protein